MRERRQAKLESFFVAETSKFLLGKREHGTLTTITQAEISESGDRLKIFISVLPETKESEVMKNLQGSAKELRIHLASKLQGNFVPEINFQIDQGEKNRARLEKLLQGNHSENP